MGVNDLRTTRLFAHRAALPSDGTRLAVRTGAIGDELYVLLGDAAAVFVVPDTALPRHADVRVIDSATGRLRLDHSVRYRQLPADVGASPVCVRARE